MSPPLLPSSAPVLMHSLFVVCSPKNKQCLSNPTENKQLAHPHLLAYHELSPFKSLVK